MGFQAWLGKTVVDSVLNPVKITTHMLTALLIVAFQLITIHTFQKRHKLLFFDSKFNWVIVLSLTLTLIQVVLGTSVREHVDTISETGLPKILWLQNPSISFYIHRSFSILVLATNWHLFSRNKKLNLGFSKINWVMVLLIIEIVSGIAIGPALISANAFLKELVPLSRLNESFAFLGAAISIGITIGSTLSGLIVEEFDGWKGFYFMT